jgi:hypothetical protein
MGIFDHPRWDSFRPAFFYRLCSRPLRAGERRSASVQMLGPAVLGPSSQRCGRAGILRLLHSGRPVGRLSGTEARTTITP